MMVVKFNSVTCFAISKSMAVIILKSNNWEGGRVKEIQEVKGT